MTTKYTRPFVELTFKVYMPEGSAEFEQWLERIENTLGQNEALTPVGKDKTRPALKKVAGGSNNVQK